MLIRCCLIYTVWTNFHKISIDYWNLWLWELGSIYTVAIHTRLPRLRVIALCWMSRISFYWSLALRYRFRFYFWLIYSLDSRLHYSRLETIWLSQIIFKRTLNCLLIYLFLICIMSDSLITTSSKCSFHQLLCKRRSRLLYKFTRFCRRWYQLSNLIFYVTFCNLLYRCFWLRLCEISWRETTISATNFSFIITL